MVQLVHAFFCRSVKGSLFRVGVLGNKLLVYADALSVILLVMGVYIPGTLSFVAILIQYYSHAIQRFERLARINTIGW